MMLKFDLKKRLCCCYLKKKYMYLFWRGVLLTGEGGIDISQCFVI